MWRSSIQAWMPLPLRRRRGVGSFFVYLFSRVDLLQKDTHHPLQEGACCDAQNAWCGVRVVLGIEASTRQRTLR